MPHKRKSKAPARRTPKTVKKAGKKASAKQAASARMRDMFGDT